MADKYCVFWYPTIFHNKLTPIKNFASIDFFGNIEKRSERKDCYVIENEISDGVGKKHHVEIKLDKSNKNLLIESKIEGEDSSTTLELKHIDSRRNGLVLYSYQLEDKNKSIEFVLKDGIYHLAKSFYHSHELKDDGDALLYAYIIDNPEQSINLDEDDNLAIVHFLTLYERKFKKYAQSISDDFTYLESIKDDEIQIGRNYSIRCRALNEFCENALIEYVYCKTLFESKYNKLIRIGANSEIICDPETLIECVDLKKKDLYKIALNIESSIRYIKYIQKKNWNILETFSTDITHGALKASTRSGNISIALGILGAFLGALSLYLALKQ